MRRRRAVGRPAQHVRAPLTEEARESRYQSGLSRLLRHQLEPVGHSAKLGKGTGVHLPNRPAAVDLYRCFGDADIASNLFAKYKATARPQS